MSTYSPPRQSAPLSFASYASRLLSASTLTTATAADPPLFYSTRDWEVPVNLEDDILGDSDDGGGQRSIREEGRALSWAGQQSDQEEGRQGRVPESGVWERSAAFVAGRFMRGGQGWKAHESRAFTVGDVYQEFESESSHPDDDADDEDEASPPSFLSPLPMGSPPSAAAMLQEPLLQPRTLYLYPSTSRGGARSSYQDSRWIVFYGGAVLAAAATGLKLVFWDGLLGSNTPTTSLFPTLPTLSLLALLSLLAGLAAMAYLLSLRSSIQHFVVASLVLGPVLLFSCGVVAFAGSFGDGEKGRVAMRWFALGCWVGALVMGRMGLRRRKSIQRTVKVLELASTILLAHPPLLLLSLSLCALSTLIAIPFLFVLSGLLSNPTQSMPYITLGSLGVLGVYLWTLAIMRGLQRVTVAGVVGNWYFERHELDHPGSWEVTKASFARATGPSLGTTIAASFLLALFSTLSSVLTRLRGLLRSPSVPTLLQPLTYLVPIIGILHGLLEIYTGYVLVFAGLSGEAFSGSAAKVGKLLRGNSGLLGDNLLVKTILSLTSILWALLAGLVSYLVASPRLPADSHLAPLLAVLCFLLPMWTLKLCTDIIVDATDTLFVAFNMDLEKNTSHCAKAIEAFGEPDTDSLA